MLSKVMDLRGALNLAELMTWPSFVMHFASAVLTCQLFEPSFFGTSKNLLEASAACNHI